MGEGSSNGNGNVCQRKTPMTDYAHTRPRMLLKKESKEADEIHRAQLYYGRSSTEVTANMQPKPPAHAYSPHQPPSPSNYSLKYTEITTLALGITPIKRVVDDGSGDRTPGKYNRIITDITEKLRNVVTPVPPPPSDDPEPYYGRSKTYITDPCISDFPPKQTSPSIDKPQGHGIPLCREDSKK